MAKRDFRYLALSHMWGDSNVKHLKLLTSNIAESQKAIPLDKLSSIYREAIRVTLALGYKYLWVDSLCIIQDKDHPDWTYEARQMATVYGNADCNLAFLFPSMSDDTSRTRSDPRDWNPCILRAATSTRPGISINHSTIVNKRNEQKHWLVQRDWPLFGRAWTFQEYLLSPRTLLLGHRNLMFQCSRHFYDELLGPIKEAAAVAPDGTPYRGRAMGKWRYFPADLTKGWDKQVDMSSHSALQLMTDWQASVNEYRARNLTYAKDRIVAFAGIARAFANMGSLTYLAGCWAEYFSLTLLWYIDRRRPPLVAHGQSASSGKFKDIPKHVHEVVVHNSPSWSPFSVPIFTQHQSFFLLNEDEQNARLRFEQYAPNPPVYWHDIHWSYLDSFRFPGYTMDEVPFRCFDKFEGLEVTLKMPVLPVETSWLKLLEKQLASIRARNALDAKITWKQDFKYYPDDPTSPPSMPKQSVLALVSEFQLCRAPGLNNVERRSAGLVIREVRRGKWRRVGAWKLKVVITSMEIDESIAGHVARRWRKHKLFDDGRKDGWRMEKVSLV